MPVVIPDSHGDLLERPIYAVLTTVMPDGQPQSTIVWVDYDGEYVRVNTARGRQKERNMQRNAKVTLMLLDPDNAFRWLEVRGQVADIVDDDEAAVAHIDRLSHKYTGRDYYGGSAPADRRHQEQRMIFKIAPTKVTPFGS